MEFSKKLFILQSVIRANLFGLKRPIAVQYALTNRCPWKCRYCGIVNMPKQECTTEESVRIINELADMGTQRLHFTGGEPALRTDLDILAATAKKRGLMVTMATTGYNFQKIKDKIRDFDIFFLSFDGPEEIHDSTRGKGAYKVLREAMDVIKSMGKRFWTTTVISQQNINHIDFVLEEAKRNNFMANFHLLYYTNTPTILEGAFHLAAADADLVVGHEAYKDAVRMLLRRKRTDMKGVIASSEAYLKALLGWKNLSEPYCKEPSPDYRCWAGKLYCYIDANGDIYPCGDIMGRVKPRNCIKEGVEKAFMDLPPLPCESCIVACFNELNQMFSLRPSAILNWVKKV